MEHLTQSLTPAALIAACVVSASAARADDGDQSQQLNRFAVTALVSDVPVKNMNPTIDPVLRNAWGVAFSPAASPFWVADNASGCATLYDGVGAKVSLQGPGGGVAIPLSGNSVPSTACQPAAAATTPSPPTPAAPTGLVWNPTTAPAGFLVPGTNIAASFIFDTEDGTISAWAGGIPDPSHAVIAFDNSASGAVYKGLAVGTNAKGVFLFATNFNAGTVDVFGPANANSNDQYVLVTSFVDPKIPAGFAPFGIQNIDGNLFVTYAKQNAAKHDDVAGPGNGFVDIFDTDGNLVQRFASRGALNSPWGITRASFVFGGFSGDILVGNFGNGKINAFDSTGDFLDALRDGGDKPLVIDGLWTLVLGGGRNSNSDVLYFTAGPNGETNGLFGTITPVSKR
jgi:uncharacterized protein (TIGR03118 family)